MSNQKIAVITGANKGIGSETARQLGKEGVKVLLGTRDLAKGEAAAKKLQAEGIDVQPLEIDVNDEKASGKRRTKWNASSAGSIF